MTPNKMKDVVSDLVENIMDAGRDVLTQAKVRASEAATTAGAAIREGAETRAEAGKDMLADEGQRLARSLRDAAAEQGDGTIQGRILDTVATGVVDRAESLRGRSFNSMLTQTESFARRNPGAFVAVATLAGFALARFARSSAPIVDVEASDSHSPARARAKGHTTKADVQS